MTVYPRPSTLAQAREALLKLRADKATRTERGMSLHQALLHCAQSIDFSLAGFPKMKNGLVRATVGRLVARHFLAKGEMHHNLAAPVPGAPALEPEGDLDAAFDRLLQAIDRFTAHSGPVRPHFMFGNLTKDEFGRLHAMHLADHFSAVTK